MDNVRIENYNVRNITEDGTAYIDFDLVTNNQVEDMRFTTYVQTGTPNRNGTAYTIEAVEDAVRNASSEYIGMANTEENFTRMSEDIETVVNNIFNGLRIPREYVNTRHYETSMSLQSSLDFYMTYGSGILNEQNKNTGNSGICYKKRRG